MAKPTQKNVFKTYDSKPETALDKTTRIVRKMADDEAEKRQNKIARLRKARLEREACAPAATKAKPARKTQR